MKRFLAVALLLLSFASAAFADGSGDPPARNVAKPAKPGAVLLADGSDLPPVNVATLAPGEVTG
jgi:hypothetical protein